MFLSNSVLIDVLREATQEELISITSLIENEKVDKSLSISKIRKEICEIGGHSLVNFFRGDGVGYLEILYDISKELKTKNVNSYDDEAKYYDDVDELKYDKQISKEMGIKTTISQIVLDELESFPKFIKNLKQLVAKGSKGELEVQINKEQLEFIKKDLKEYFGSYLKSLSFILFGIFLIFYDDSLKNLALILVSLGFLKVWFIK